MTLRLAIENVAQLTSGDPVTVELDRHGMVIGRAPHVDWTLPDPQSLISSRHCEIDYRDGSYWLTDHSTNGTFVNGSGARLGAPHRIVDGDMITIGQYAVRALLPRAGEAAAGDPFGTGTGAGAAATGSVWGGNGGGSARPIPPERFGAEPPRAIFASGDRSAPDRWHGPVPIVAAADPFGLGGAGTPTSSAPGGADPFGLGVGGARATEPQVWSSPLPPEPAVWSSPPAPASPIPVQAESIWGKLAAPERIDFTPTTAVAVAVPEQPLSSGPAPRADAAFAQFLSAAGLRAADLAETPPARVLAAAGELLRQTADGLIRLLNARARLRHQFGIGAEVTTFQRSGNNPLKWTRSGAEAMRQLVGTPDAGFLPGPQAVQGAFEDLQAHEMATMAAMQEAVKATVERFAPAAIRARVSDKGFFARLLPGAREAALWQAYETEYRALADESEAAWLDLFARHFKAAYARNIARVDRGAG